MKKKRNLLDFDSTTQDAMSPRETTTLNNLDNPIDIEKVNLSKKHLRFGAVPSNCDSDS